MSNRPSAAMVVEGLYEYANMKMKSWLRWVRIIILTLIVIVFILLGVPLMLNCALGHNTPCDFEVVGTEVNWLDFWGAYIGAIIGGLITLIPMKRETDRNALNIMINNHENYIKELKSQLRNNICNIKFKPIGDFDLPIKSNNQSIDKNRVDDIIRGLNDTLDSAKHQLDSWCIIYSEETGKTENFKKAYKECIDEFENDIKEITVRLGEILNDDERYKRGQKEDWTLWIIAFRKKLKEHQETHRQTMLKAAQDWLKGEQKELDKLRNQLIAFYPRIKSKNN